MGNTIAGGYTDPSSAKWETSFTFYLTGSIYLTSNGPNGSTFVPNQNFVTVNFAQPASGDFVDVTTIVTGSKYCGIGSGNTYSCKVGFKLWRGRVPVSNSLRFIETNIPSTCPRQNNVVISQAGAKFVFYGNYGAVLSYGLTGGYYISVVGMHRVECPAIYTEDINSLFIPWDVKVTTTYSNAITGTSQDYINGEYGKAYQVIISPTTYAVRFVENPWACPQLSDKGKSFINYYDPTNIK